LFGGVAGIIAALWATAAFVALAPPGVPRIDEVAMDGRILAFGLGITFLSALIFGLAPASRVRAFNLTETLKDGRSDTGDRRSSRLRQLLVVTELALALALVLSAGLLLRSFGTLVAWNPGFDYHQVLTFQIYPPQSRYPDGASVVAFYRDAKDQLEGLPGVTSVGTASAGPLFGGDDGTVPFQIQGRPPVPIQEAPRARWYDVGPGYFPTLGLPIVQGRNLTEADALGQTPAILVNEAFAQREWPDGGSPVGARLHIPDWDMDATVVGVVPTMKPLQPDAMPEPQFYISNRQRPRWASYFLLRVDGDPTALAPAVRQLVSGLGPDIEAYRLATLEDNLADRLVGPRFNLLLVAIFALVALLLGATGVYGVIAYAVALRTREIGIRMALGAGRREVLMGVVVDGLKLVGAGLLAGAVVAVIFTRLLQGVLVGVQATDPVALIGTVLVLAAAGAAASLFPALRAARTDPVEAIRAE
jgi:putative ABC transport system permease protein